MKQGLSLPLLLLTVSLLSGCKEEEPAKTAALTTATVTNITATTATSGGTISSDGGAAITARGVCWSSSADPTTSDSKTTDGEGTGQFESNMTGLVAGTTYHVRAYATNSVGTAYGEDITFTTSGLAPSATTQDATNISSGGSILHGTVNANGLTTTISFEYGTTTGYGQSVPAVPGQIPGDYNIGVTAALTGLSSNTTYHFRIKAVSSAGTAYGSDLTFATTGASNQVTDIDGNIYNTVTIGTQVWLKENLKATKYNDGTAIPNVTDNTAWSSNSTGAYCDYSNTPSSSSTYGRLYNWYVVASTNPKNVCPTGWHVPSDTEWNTLIIYSGGDVVAGGKLKETGTVHWLSPNTGATNESGFTALPGGYRSETGTFGLIGNSGYWWSSIEGGTTFAWDRYMYYNSGNAVRADMDKNGGFSVRCLKN
jgi:uncharacterized protein (TIGR02145 family)